MGSSLYVYSLVLLIVLNFKSLTFFSVRACMCVCVCVYVCVFFCVCIVDMP